MQHNEHDGHWHARTQGGNGFLGEDGAISEGVREQIHDTGSIISTVGKYSIHCMSVIGQIEGHQVLSAQNKSTRYEHIMPQLVAVEQSEEIDGLIILLNTVGGDVEAGLALAELISGMKTPTVSLVLGGGHSIGIPLAVSARRSFIVPSATMTVHPVRMSGLVIGVPQTLDHFDRMQRRITNFVSSNSRITPERFLALSRNTEQLVMDIGTVLDGEQAVAEGLIDELGSLSDALACLYDMIESQREAKPGSEGEEKSGTAQSGEQPEKKTHKSE